jgi:uncharacterized membrane protein
VKAESRWPSTIAVLAAAALYATLPAKLVPSPAMRYAVPALFLAVVVPLTIAAPHRRIEESGRRRRAAETIIALITVANAITLTFLIHQLLYAGGVEGRALLYGAFDVWTTNVIAFALWYWELDGGGPPKRLADPKAQRDFAFPQMSDPELAPAGWEPLFLDYLYLSFTNSSAFSPTDTLPLTRWAKVLMLLESSASILTLLLVGARAVNILR